MDNLTDIVKDIEDTSNNGRVHKVASVSALATAGLVAGQAVELIGYHEDTTVGGGSGVIKTARHNGGTAISLTRSFPTDWTDQAQLTAWFADSDSDEPCFVRNQQNVSSVTWFGVVSHPTNNVNASSNVHALNAMFTKGIKYFHFPSGYYWLTGTLDFTEQSGVEVIGEGKNRTSLRWFNTTGVGLKIGHPTVYNSGGSIRDINMYGTIISGTDYTDRVYENSALLELGGMVNQFEMRNVNIQFAEIGIDSTLTSNNWNRLFDNVQIANVGTAFQASESNANHFNRCMIFLCRDRGLEITGFGIAFTGTSFESLASSVNSLLKVSSRGCSIDGCYFEGADKAIELSGSHTNKSKGTLITGCYLTGTTDVGSIGIYTGASTGLVIAGNFIRRFEQAIKFEDNASFNNMVMCNTIEDSTIDYAFNSSDRIGHGQWHTQTLSANWDLSTNTREGLQASVIHAGHTTLNSLNDVRLNDSAYEWRTWIGGRDGSDGGARPTRDNSQNFGSASNRWAEIFSGNGAINTSDEREKTFEDITEAETACALDVKKAIRKFKWNDAIEERGVDSSRLHFGVGAQTIANIFTSHGLDTNDYSLFCYDEWDDVEVIIPESIGDAGNVIAEHVKVIREAGNRYGIRYTELLCFMVLAL